MRDDSRTGANQDSVKATVRLSLWTFAWVGSMALATFGPQQLWDSQPVSWAAVAANLAAGTGWIVAHARYLRAIDELQRKIMQDALSITLGVGWVGGFAFVVAEAADLFTFDGDVGVFAALLGVVYLIATFGGHIRYR